MTAEVPLDTVIPFGRFWRIRYGIRGNDRSALHLPYWVVERRGVGTEEWNAQTLEIAPGALGGTSDVSPTYRFGWTTSLEAMTAMRGLGYRHRRVQNKTLAT